MALVNARLLRLERAVLHTAAGGVGLIALEYAWLCAAEAIATAGGALKHRVVREQVSPGCHLLVSHSSRSGGAFTTGAFRLIRALRVHAVLNSLSADLTSASFALLGQSSSFVEIGKRRCVFPLRIRARMRSTMFPHVY